MNEIINQCCKIWEIDPEHFVFATTRRRTAQKKVLGMILAQHKYTWKQIGSRLNFKCPQNSAQAVKRGVEALRRRDDLEVMVCAAKVWDMFLQDPLTYDYANRKISNS